MSKHALLLGALLLPLFAAAPHPAANDDHEDVVKTIAAFKEKDPGIAKFFSSAVGYAVFPSIGKGAIGIGGAHGSGELLVGGNAIGKTSMTQVTIGLQLGGQAYAEVIFFQTQDKLNAFKKGDFEFAAQVSAVAPRRVAEPRRRARSRRGAGLEARGPRDVAERVGRAALAPRLRRREWTPSPPQEAP